MNILWALLGIVGLVLLIGAFIFVPYLLGGLIILLLLKEWPDGADENVPMVWIFGAATIGLIVCGSMLGMALMHQIGGRP